jgi:hypothetical protein
VQGVTQVTNNMTLAGGTAGTMGTTPSSSTTTGSMGTAADNRAITTARAPRTDRN